MPLLQVCLRGGATYKLVRIGTATFIGISIKICNLVFSSNMAYMNNMTNENTPATAATTPTQEPTTPATSTPSSEFTAAIESNPKSADYKAPTAEPAPKRPAEVRQRDNANAQRRIRGREYNSLRSRITELEAKFAEVSKSNEPGAKYEAQNIRDRIDDLSSAQTDRDLESYRESAKAELGENLVDQFMEESQRYGAHVNQNEPELRHYTDRPYGKILLHEWFRRMDDPKLHDEWTSFTAYEKSKVLDNFYHSINESIKNYKQSSAPVPGSGRDTTAVTPADDFGIAFQESLNRRKRQSMR